MKPITLLSAATLLSALTGVAAARLALPPADRAANRGASEEIAQIGAALASVESRQSDFATDLAGLRADLAGREFDRDRSEANVPLDEIERAVARALAARSGGLEGTATEGNPSPASSGLDARTAYEALRALRLSGDAAEKKWKEIMDAGLLDEVVALFEQRARENPNDPDAQSDLGLACMKQSLRLIGTQDGYAWVAKGDKCFDAALAVDEHNWRARFLKATGLSFWPPLLGKQPEAIHHFEILLAQQEQEGTPAHGGYAKTYLFLGNLYVQSGDLQKALATWKQGLALFPDDAELRSQIANSEHH